MSVLVVTGSAGLVGSEAVRHWAEKGFDVVGIDNDMRSDFFGPEASTRWMRERLSALSGYTHHDVDIRDEAAIEGIFSRYGREISGVIHAAAQPSHDWAATEPLTDFSVNATGTLVLLEATRRHAPEAGFLFLSTNKVYGDAPNRLPLKEKERRWEIDPSHRFYGGISEEMSIDRSMHSLFGVSKAAADLLVQEYGRYFGLRTVCFRGGCLTGPNHSGTQLHGFLAYLMKCAATGARYRVFGYRGKQVRDNIHSADLIAAFEAVLDDPPSAEVYNIGGGRRSHCSMLEAIDLCQEITGRELDWEYAEESRLGDHIWWISDLSRFRARYPAWDVRRDVPAILTEIYEANRDRWGR